MLTLGFAALAVTTVVLTAAAPLLVASTRTRQPGAGRARETFALWCIPQVFFYGMYTLLGQVLNARGSSARTCGRRSSTTSSRSPASPSSSGCSARRRSPAPTDVDWWTTGQMALLAGTATLGVVAQAVVLVLPLRRTGFRYRPRWGLRGAGLGAAGGAALDLRGLAVGPARVPRRDPGDVRRTAAAVAGCDGVRRRRQRRVHAAFMSTCCRTRSSPCRSSPRCSRAWAGTRARPTSPPSAPTSRGHADHRRVHGLRDRGLHRARPAADARRAATASCRRRPTPSPRSCWRCPRARALGAWSLCQRVYYAYEDARSLFWIQVVMAAVVGGGARGPASAAPAWWVVGRRRGMSLSNVVGPSSPRGACVGASDGSAGPGCCTCRRASTLAALVVRRGRWPGPAAARAGPVDRAWRRCSVRRRRHRDGWCTSSRCASCASGAGQPGPAVPPPAAPATPLSRHVEHAGCPVQVTTTEVLVARSSDGAPCWPAGTACSPVASDLAGAAWEATDQILDRRSASASCTAPSPRRSTPPAAPPSSPTRASCACSTSARTRARLRRHRAGRGPSLAELVARTRCRPTRPARVVGEAAAALEAARRRGVHHLALRPSVLHVTPDDRVLLTGLAFDGALLGDGRRRRPVDHARRHRRPGPAPLRRPHRALAGRPTRRQTPGGDTLPPAPVVDGAPVPPADLVPGVPNDLDTLCAVTLGPHDDGPHSPGELVRELEPWGEIRTSVPDPSAPVAPPAQFPPTGAAAPGGGSPGPTRRQRTPRP